MTTILRIFIVAATFWLGAGPGMAQDSMSTIYGNTLSVTYPDGATVLLFVNGDQTYSGKLPDGSEISGVWELTGTELCFTRQLPTPEAPACDEFDNKQVDDTWQGTGLNDLPVTLTLLEGHN